MLFWLLLFISKYVVQTRAKAKKAEAGKGREMRWTRL